MALFKVNRGNSANLPAEMHDGWAYFCTDTAEFYIDYLDESNTLQRKQINADEAKRLTSQIDWLQNDESASDYVKNRFGGYYENTYSTVLEETTLEFEPYTSDNGYYTYIDDYNIAEMLFGSKSTVRVTFDDVVYEKAFDKNSGFDSDETIPFGFYVQIADGAHLHIDTILEGDTHTVKIEKVEKLPVTISEEFLPDSVKVQADWNQNDETASDYIKNRFGGYYDDVDNLYVEEKTLTFTQNSNNPSLYELVDPEQLPYLCWEGSPSKIKIIFDGTEYVLNEVTGTNYYGNASLFYSSYEDTGEPIGVHTTFSAGEGSDYEATDIHTTIAGSSHTVEIYTVISSPVAIPEKFTPTLATKTSVEDAIQLKQQNLTTTINVRSDGYAYGNGIVITYSANSYSYITRSLDEGNIWESIEIPEGFYKIVFGNGKFVAMPYSNFNSQTGNTIYYSVDGLIWTAATLPSERRWRGLVYGKGLFLAFGRFDTYAYSEDGINWTQTSWPDDSDCEGACGVIYANEKFVITDGRYVYTSADGMTWNSTAINSNLSIKKLTYGNGVFIGTDYYYENAYLYSEDGITWEEISAPVAEIRDITYGANVFVMIPYSPSTIAYYSSDGLNWTQVNTGAQGGPGWKLMAFCENQFFATAGYGYNIMYSSDGIKWRSTKDILKDTGGAYITSRVYTALGIDEKIQAAIGAAMEAIY